jgi:hypothetical protein
LDAAATALPAVCSATIRMVKRVNQDGKFLAGRILELSRRI